MTKSDLIMRMFEQQQGFSEVTVKSVIDGVLEQLQQALIAGNRIEIRGFGAFTVPLQSSRTSRNPKTGGSLITEAKRKIRFKAGKELRERVKQSVEDTQT